jgi:hypothetical protein
MVIKHGVALDAPFVDWLEQNLEKLLARERTALTYAVRRSCELKRPSWGRTNARRACGHTSTTAHLRPRHRGGDRLRSVVAWRGGGDRDGHGGGAFVCAPAR